MKKIKKTNKKIIYIIFLVLIGSILLLLTQNKVNLVPIISEELDIAIMVPSHYEVTQRFTTITIANEKGEITIDRYGSFFDNLDQHISDLSKKNNVRIEILEKIPSDKYQIYKVKFDKGTRTKPEDISYLILTKSYAIYTFQASSEELYTDLDAIAKSFRYNP